MTESIPIPDFARGLTVLRRLDSGKEATAFCCRVDTVDGPRLVLAKVFKSSTARSFHNDAIYREGLYIADRRLRRAAHKHTKAGRDVNFSTWINNEYETLRILYTSGADVPEPLFLGGNTIFMEYIGDEDSPALQLSKVKPDTGEARVLFKHLVSNIGLWLANYRVHADLSPFNILYWQGQLKVIDFPQSVDPRTNSSAYMLLHRDVDNICRYFGKLGVQCESWRIADDLWQRYLSGCLDITRRGRHEHLPQTTCR